MCLILYHEIYENQPNKALFSIQNQIIISKVDNKNIYSKKLHIYYMVISFNNRALTDATRYMQIETISTTKAIIADFYFSISHIYCF